MVPPRPGPPNTTGNLVTSVDRALPELLAEHPELAGRVVERSAVLGRASCDSSAQLVPRVARERRPALTDRIERVGVAVPDVGESVVVGEPHDTIVPWSTECRGVECLDRIRPNGVVRVVQEAAVVGVAAVACI